MENCLFCRIAAGEMPARVVLEDDEMVVFEDISPRAPTHLLVVPRRHVESLAAAREQDHVLLGRLLAGAARAARELGLEQHGYRVVINTGAGAGQTVFHLHLHVLGGRPLAWPPG